MLIVVYDPIAKRVIFVGSYVMRELILASYPGAQCYGTSAPGPFTGIPADGVLLNPAPDLYAYAASKRDAILESQRIAVGAFTVPTDKTTRSVLTAAMVNVARDGGYVVDDWKVGPGVYVSLDATALTMMADAVEAAVQAMFTRNKAADMAIASGTAKTTADVDKILAGG